MNRCCLCKQYKKINPNEEDKALKELLISWDSEFIYQKCVGESIRINFTIYFAKINFNDFFSDEYVDIECLKLFQKHHVKTLMEGLPLGLAVKFEHKLLEWQNSIASVIAQNLSPPRTSAIPRSAIQSEIPATTINSSLAETSAIATTSSPLITVDSFIYSQNNQIDVETIIKQTTYGIQIITQYEEERKMTDAQRNVIVNGIIDYIYSKNLKMTTALAKDIAEQIVGVFKFEEIVSSYLNLYMYFVFVFYKVYYHNIFPVHLL